MPMVRLAHQASISSVPQVIVDSTRGRNVGKELTKTYPSVSFCIVSNRIRRRLHRLE